MNKHFVKVWGNTARYTEQIWIYFCYFFSQGDGWDTEPFVLTEKDGKLYGRGSTDDKGPVLAWINCLEAMKELGQEVPINLKVSLANPVNYIN